MLLTFFQTTYIWIIFLIISFVFFPLSKHFFGRTFDNGWIFAKLIGLLIVSYVAYLVGIFNFWKFSNLELWLIIFFVFVFNSAIKLKNGFKLTHFSITIDTRIVVLELIFLFFLLLMAFVRGFQPDIYGLEKYMDYGFIRSITEGSFFPPKDLWWSGEPINYYYFGHLWIAVLIKISGVDPAIGYNLALSSVFALSTTLIVVIVRNWTKNIWFGILGAILHSGLGNLHLITTIIRKTWNEYLLIESVNQSFYTGLVNINLIPAIIKRIWLEYWYPDASRLIPGVITEFPVYSYVVYDLHAHVINIPVVILYLGLISQVFRKRSIRYIDSLLLGFILGVCFMANAWDLPIYLFVSLIAVLIFVIKNSKSISEVINVLKRIAFVLLTVAMTILPFLLFFKKVDAPILVTNYHSPIDLMIQLWGYWIFIAVSFLVFLFIRKKKIMYFDWFIISLFLAAIILLIIPEFFYVKDIYGDDYQRANTVFKLTYQSWNIFALAATYSIWKIYKKKVESKIKYIKFSWLLVVFLLTLACGAYTIKAYITGYGEFKIFYGLDGDRFISKIYSEDEVAGIEWIRKNTDSEEVVLEASGDSYTDYQRISVNTGRPTVVGWAVHEWLWRGGFDPVGKRQSDVEKIYITSELNEFAGLVKKYKIKYVYFGALEKQKYAGSPGQALIESSTIVFSNSNVTIYEIKI